MLNRLRLAFKNQENIVIKLIKAQTTYGSLTLKFLYNKTKLSLHSTSINIAFLDDDCNCDDVLPRLEKCGTFHRRASVFQNFEIKIWRPKWWPNFQNHQKRRRIHFEGQLMNTAV